MMDEIVGVDPRVFQILRRAQDHGVVGKAPLVAHVEQARSFYSIVSDDVVPNARVLDLGSGGGIPGLVIADQWPDLRVTLLEGRSRRSEDLRSAIDGLGWGDRLGVISQRAEEAARDPFLRHTFDVVVARGFGPPAVTAECASPFLEAGGLLVVSDPPGGGESRWPADGCGQLGLEVERQQIEPWAFTVLRQMKRCPEQFPRRTGVPAKRPLFV